MIENSLPLAAFYKGWDEDQKHLIGALAPLSAEQLSLCIAPHLRSVGIIARHIIGARARWLYYVLKEGDKSLEDLGSWDGLTQPERSAAELVSGLEQTWQVIQKALERWTAADLAVLCSDVDENGQEETFTRQWVLWHLIEHDLHHGGEISFSLGMYNLTAIDL